MLRFNYITKLSGLIFLAWLSSGCATNTGVSKSEVNRIEDAHPYEDIYRVIGFNYIGNNAPSRLKDAFNFSLGLVSVVASNVVSAQVNTGQLGLGSGLAREINNGLMSGAGSSFSSILSANKGTYVITYTSAFGFSFQLDRLRDQDNYYNEFIVVDNEPVQALEVGDYIFVEKLPKDKQKYKAEYKYVRIDQSSRINKKIAKSYYSAALQHQLKINKARGEAVADNL